MRAAIYARYSSDEQTGGELQEVEGVLRGRCIDHDQVETAGLRELEHFFHCGVLRTIVIIQF